MTLTAGDRTVGVWPLEVLEVSSRSDGFHIRVDGEEMVLNVTDSKRFAAELGVDKRPRRTAVAKDDQPPAPPSATPTQSSTQPKANGAAKPPTAKVTSTAGSGQPETVEGRIAGIATALTTDKVSPAEAFAEWLRLAKELNRLHAEGAMTSDTFNQLNTQLLDLLPDPIPDPV
jgi:hypothetical protein